jgi:hypothetical protein
MTRPNPLVRTTGCDLVCGLPYGYSIRLAVVPNMEGDFKHIPLRKGNDIRPLRVRPGDSGDEVACDLVVTNLSSHPPFLALSYTWGDPTGSKAEIMLTGVPVKVQKNLHDALQALRLPDASFYLWADAICINQADDAEKSSQVQQMRDIYASAVQVKAWLGPYTGNSDMPEYDWDDPRRPIFTIARRRKFWPVLAGPSQAYWSRVWVMQELVVVAKSIEVCCGRARMQFNPLAVGCAEIFDEYGRMSSVARSAEVWTEQHDIAESLVRVLTIKAARRSHFAGVKRNLRQTLVFFKSCKSTDLRDKVYALLGLAHTGVGAGVTVDYSHSINDVYINAACHILESPSADSLTLLSCANPALRRAGLPSWVPDWSATTDTLQSYRATAMEGEAYSVASTTRPDFEVLEYGRTLRLKALLCGTMGYLFAPPIT